MNQRVQTNSLFEQTAGLRLRCFLGSTILVFFLLGLLSLNVAQAQIEIDKPLHVKRVEGYVFDTANRPVVDAKVELLRDGYPAFSTTTSERGWFQFKEASGHYVLLASVGVAEAGRQIDVGNSLKAFFRRGPLYLVIRTRGACMDCSIRVYTSRKQLNSAFKKIDGFND